MRTALITLAVLATPPFLTGCLDTKLGCQDGYRQEGSGDNIACIPLDGSIEGDSGPVDGGGRDASDADATSDGSPDACTPSCSGATPHCDEEAGACVACLTHSHCSDPDAARCLEGACVPCTASAQCAGVPGGVDLCNTDIGRCVQCTESDRSVCGGNACKPDGTCSEYPHQTQEVCSPCDTDRNCVAGQVCVEMTYDDPPQANNVVGSFCQWEKDATSIGAPNGTCGLSSRPFARELSDASTVDERTVTICTLQTTTCLGFLHHREQVDGCTTPGTDDNACGASGFDDGLCRMGSDGPLCTYRCGGSDARDCPAGFSCTGPQGARYCEI